MPAVASVGAESKGATTAATLAAPAFVAAGDLLVAVLLSDTSSNTFAQPEGGGWTQLQRSNSSGADALEVWWKIASGSNSYAFVQSAASPWVGIALRVIGHDPSAPIAASGKSGSAVSVTSLKTASLTTTRSPSLILSIFGEDGDATGLGWSLAGATELFDFQETVSFCEIAGYSEEKATPGEVSRTAELAAANECNSVILAVQPPLADGPRPGSRALLGVGR